MGNILTYLAAVLPTIPTGPRAAALPLSLTPRGARIRHQLERDRESYQAVYKQHTATERIFSQALNLSIERPKLRHQAAIANQNTLIYLFINLRAMQRVREKLAIQE